jgi:BirA family transcriptional regulator, biotin operon repressor / biotin---[acetyl-CoA-carboxylase] ligase
VNDASWSAAADPSRRIGRSVEFHPEIGSTSDRAREALVSGVGDGLAVVADLQTAGRGRRGRTWTSPSGVNLMLSVAIRPRIGAADAGLLGIAAALAVRDACSAMAPSADLFVRWPNDVVAADGRKLAGLLVETAIEAGHLAEAVIGMGINVN